MSQKHELVITALQQRIGEIVSNYETQIAILRADITEMVNSQEQKQKEFESYEKEIEEKLSNL